MTHRRVQKGQDLYSSVFRANSVVVLPLNQVILRRGHHISSISVAVLSLKTVNFGISGSEIEEFFFGTFTENGKLCSTRVRGRRILGFFGIFTEKRKKLSRVRVSGILGFFWNSHRKQKFFQPESEVVEFRDSWNIY